jgi:signal transduction histidine kinase
LAPFPADEWQALQAGLGSTTDRQASFVSGELNDPRGRVLAWSALQALSSGDSHGGALLVLREITEAKESEKLRQDLTHMIVHDLRSPLSSVMASVDMLMRGVTGGLNDSQQHVLTIASDSAQQMLAMINTLLDINRLEAGRMPLSLEQVDLCATIRRASSQLATLAHERNITIETDCSVEAGIVQADPALLVRVAQNLIVNAIKFSGRSGKVSVRVGQSPEGVLVQIHDQGIGIATKDRDKIFTKFGQVGERRGGTGLGLTFCKLVVETHGGRIWVDSQIGEGSTFSFIIPN